MMWGPVDILLALLAVTLAAVIVGDWRTRTIPNWLNGAIALLAIPFWWIAGLLLWPDVAVQLGMALMLFLLFALAFRFGAMGGGDVKLIAALALWLPPLTMIKLLLVMSLAGGLLTVVMLIRHRLAEAGHKLEIPYGIAIAFGGFWVLGERYLNQFG
jgi:prepilin peptidase CpaA